MDARGGSNVSNSGMITLRRAAVAALVLFLVAQVVPFGRAHSNPPVVEEPSWDQPRTRELFFLACKDCHSNETAWPWYSQIAPLSWLVQRDVNEGRSEFNVSEWGRAKNEGDEAAGHVRDGEMPPWFYLPAHPEARLSESEQAELIEGLIATFGEESDHGEPHDH